MAFTGRPRLASLDLFASALLASLGVGCAQVVFEEDGAGGGGASGPGGEGASGPVGTSGPSGPAGTGGGSVGNSTGVGSSGASTGPTSSATGTGSAASSSGSGGGSPDCEDPVPILVDGIDTGFDTCSGGQLRRREVKTCPTSWPDDNDCCGGCPDGSLCSSFGEAGCGCVQACTTDAECGGGAVCLCGDPAGVCVSSKCQSALDCEPGEECTSWDYTLGCLYLEFACTSPEDTCGGDLDCRGDTPFCGLDEIGRRTCVFGGCDIGRPFLVADAIRTAEPAARVDWSAAIEPRLDGIDRARRAEVGEAWVQVALMEHASIAAFARFALQLMSLGAPADLIERSNRAMADETRHARAAFALASAYLGREVGPGALAIDGALDPATDAAAVLALVVREGCVGETVAAVQAAEAAACAHDPVVASVLGGVADDESEHAELAWRAVRWAMARFGSPVRAVVARELAAIEAEIARAEPIRIGPRDRALLDLGVTSAAVRARCRADVLRAVVAPCLRALLAEPVGAVTRDEPGTARR